MRGVVLTWSSSRDMRLFLIFNAFGAIAVGVGQVVFNLYLLEIGLREDAIGALNALLTIAMGLTGMILGLLLNRFGSWACTFYGMALFALSSVGMGLFEGFISLAAVSALNGIGLAFLFNTTMPFILDWGNPTLRAHASAASFSLMSFSVLVGSLLGGELPKFFGMIGDTSNESLFAFRWTLVFGGVVTLAALVPLWLMSEAKSGKAKVTHSIVAEPATQEERRQVRKDMTVFIAIGACMALGVGMVQPFFNVYMKTLGATTSQLGLIFACAYGLSSVLGLAAPAISNRWGALVSVAVLRSLTAPFAILLIFMPSYALGVLSLFARQVTASVAWPIEASFIGELLPPKSRSAVFGLRGAAWNFGVAIASFLAGIIIVRWGYDLTFISLAVFLSASGIWFMGYFGRHQLVRDGRIPSAMSSREAARRQVGAESDSQPSVA